MSSASLSSKKNSSIPIEGQLFHSIVAKSTGLSMNNPRASPDRSNVTTRIVGPRPFYRSRMTPEPFDYTNHLRRKNDSSENRPSNPQRRYSANFSQGIEKSINSSDKQQSSNDSILSARSLGDLDQISVYNEGLHGLNTHRTIIAESARPSRVVALG